MQLTLRSSETYDFRAPWSSTPSSLQLQKQWNSDESVKIDEELIAIDMLLQSYSMGHGL